MDNEKNVTPIQGTENPQNPENQNAERNGAWDLVLNVFKDKLFFYICIFTSVACGAGIMAGSVDVLGILFTIFLWMIYSKAQKGEVYVAGMRCISGTAYATYVISIIAGVLFIVIGSLLGIVLVFAKDIWNEALESVDFSSLMPSIAGSLTGMIAEIIGYAFVVGFILGGILTLILNIVGYHKIHLFAKFAYKGVESGDIDFVKYANGASAWLMVYGVFAAIAALGSLTSFSPSTICALVANVGSAMTYICASNLIKKYFVSVK